MEQGGATRPDSSMAMTEDLSVFLNTEEFADTFTHVESGATFDAIPDPNYSEEDMAEHVDYVLTAAAEDVSGIAPRDAVTKGDSRYLVVSVRPDETGMAHVLLTRG